MSEKTQRRNYLKFCFKNGFLANHILDILKKTFSKCFIESQCFGWYKLFKKDREHDERLGSSSTDDNHGNQIVTCQLETLVTSSKYHLAQFDFEEPIWPQTRLISFGTWFLTIRAPSNALFVWFSSIWLLAVFWTEIAISWTWFWLDLADSNGIEEGPEGDSRNRF